MNEWIANGLHDQLRYYKQHIFTDKKYHEEKACFAYSEFWIQPVCEGANQWNHILGLTIQDRKVSWIC